MQALLSALIRGLLTLAALVFAMGLLAALVLVVLVTSLLALLRGQRPQVTVWWTRYRDLTRGMRTGPAGPGWGQPEVRADIVDVQAKEVPESVKRLPHRD
jgi:hypothetical protein